MPSKSIGAALIELTAVLRKTGDRQLHDAPWSWPSFQPRIRDAYSDSDVCVDRAPWLHNPNGTTHVCGWSHEDIDRVKVFVDSFCNKKTVTERQKFMNKVQDSFSEGRELLRNAYSYSWEGTWGFGTIVRSTLQHFNRDKYDVVAAHGQRMVGCNFCFDFCTADVFFTSSWLVSTRQISMVPQMPLQ